MANPTPLAFFGGRLVPQEEARLSLSDAGFVWGATITDLCRTVRHQLYRWPDHLDRFRRSCRAARIYPPLDEEELDRQAQALVAHNCKLLTPGQDLALVLIATPGPVGYYLGQNLDPAETGPTFIMHTFPLPFARYRFLFQDGARLIIPTVRQVPVECVEPRIKQRSRLHWWLAQQEVQRVDSHASALLLDHAGHVTETAAANFLAVHGGVVLSPPTGSILEGVSLQVVKQLCGRLGIPFQERPLRTYDCLNADEAMLTSTPYCLVGVSQINGLPLSWPGPVFRRLLQAWDEVIGLDIRQQIERG
jgi:branched-chain amino acid aminotransferase